MMDYSDPNWRNKYPWQRELNTWLESRQDEICKEVLAGKTLAETDPGGEPVENIIKFAKIARSQPEIWEMFLEWAEPQNESNKNSSGIADGNVHGADNIAFFGQFKNWYFMKNNIMKNQITYTYAAGLLAELAHGRIESLDSEEAINYLKQFPFVEK